MDESRKQGELPEQNPENLPPTPDQVPPQSAAGRFGFGLFLVAVVVAGGFGMIVVSMPPTGGATRSAKLETQRREQLIEQAMRDAQAAEQAAVGEPEFAASDRVPDDRAP